MAIYRFNNFRIRGSKQVKEHGDVDDVGQVHAGHGLAIVGLGRELEGPYVFFLNPGAGHRTSLALRGWN